MITLSRIGNTVFFNSDKHNAPVGYYVLQFRKRANLNKLSSLRNSFRRAEQAEQNLKELSNYAQIAVEAKKAIYAIRYDLTRDLNTVIHPINEENQLVTLGQALDLTLNGQGTSAITQKKVKTITCKEKRVKVIKKLIDSIV